MNSIGRNGLETKAMDSKSKGCEFKSGKGQNGNSILLRIDTTGGGVICSALLFRL